MTGKTISFKQPAALARPVENWVEARTPPAAPVGPTKRLTVDIPAALHKRLKVHCVNNELQITDVVRQLLEQNYPAA